jgi:sugar lactone lactonase YvrE
MHEGTWRRYAVAAALLVAPAAAQQRSYVDWYQEMATAYRGGDHAAMAAAAEGALGVRPRFPAMMVNLAVARARLGDNEAALELLEQVAAMGLAFPVDGNEEFAALEAEPRFTEIVTRMAANASPTGRAEVAFTLPQRDFFPEGIAADGSGGFFVSSVRHGDIVRVGAEGEARRFARLSWSVLGLRADHARSLLWVAISGLEQRAGLAEERRGRAGIAALDLRDGALLSEHLLPAGVERVVGDLVVGADGSVYATDSIAGGLWVLRPGTNELVALLPDGALPSPQGLDFGPGGALYVAAYNGGFYRFDLRSGVLDRVALPDTVSAYGIDGLYTWGNGLVAVQNGTQPQRVIHLRLDAAGRAVTGAEVLLAAHPRFGEPTLAALSGGELHLVAASPWAYFSDPATPPDVASLPIPTVLRLALPGS